MNTKCFTGLILWLLPILISAQSTGKNFDSPENPFPEQRRGKWVVDSTWFYLGNTFGQYWFNNEQYRVTSRDQFGNFKTSLTRQFDTISQTWVDKSRNMASYYDSVNSEKWIAEIWDTKSDNWKMSDSIYYDATGAVILSWYKLWNPAKSRFSGGKRIEYDYSKNGQLVEENIQLFDTLSGNWKNGQIATYSYNNAGLKEQKLLITWDTAGFWRDSLRATYTYNAQNLLSQTIHEIKNENQQWENWWKWKYNYNENGKISEEYQFAWLLDDWENKNFNVYDYEELLLKQLLRKIWDETGLKWIDKSRTSYTYENGKRVEVLGEYFYQNEWIKMDVTTFSYDENGNRLEYLYRFWDESNGEWLNFYKDENYWSEFAPFAIAENQQLKTLIFPNPAYKELNIQMEETVKSGVISLTGLDGKTLMKRPFSGNFVQISTENLQAGCYMIFIETGLGKSSQVVIVK